MLRGAVSSDQEKLAQANTDFAFKLLQELVREQPGKNIFISPYSISTVLQMVRNGAAGETKTELDRVLGTTNFAPANLAQAYAEIANSLKKGSTNTVLDIANSIWFAPNVQLKPEFAALNREVYGATVGPLDFTDPRSSGIVNAWASQNTHGKIAEVVRGPLSGLTGALIVNAVYFKGMWASRFDPVKTKDRAFKLVGGKEKQVPMMENSGEFAYFDTGAYQIIRLPYQDRRLGMYILLPSVEGRVAKLSGEMDGARWRTNLLAGLNDKSGRIILPHFTLEYEAELNRPLSTLGVNHAFKGDAAFTGISEESLFIERIKQKTFVKVDEEGSEAAAVSSLKLFIKRAGPRDQPFTMIVDRPFLCVISDQETGSILFLGMVQDPG